MGKVLRSWFFFTALLIFLLASAAAMPDLKAKLFGRTEQTISETAQNMEDQARAVWARLQP